jgi:hypothetical protein
MMCAEKLVLIGVNYRLNCRMLEDLGRWIYSP